MTHSLFIKESDRCSSNITVRQLDLFNMLWNNRLNKSRHSCGV